MCVCVGRNKHMCGCWKELTHVCVLEGINTCLCVGRN